LNTGQAEIKFAEKKNFFLHFFFFLRESAWAGAQLFFDMRDFDAIPSLEMRTYARAGKVNFLVCVKKIANQHFWAPNLFTGRHHPEHFFQKMFKQGILKGEVSLYN